MGIHLNLDDISKVYGVYLLSFKKIQISLDVSLDKNYFFNTEHDLASAINNYAFAFFQTIGLPSIDHIDNLPSILSIQLSNLNSNLIKQDIEASIPKNQTI